MTCNHTRTELSGHNLCLYKEGVEEGIQIEQERIIKLLEENWVEPMDWLSVIALIKGDQK
jgi:hypothetical protein